MNGQLVPNQPSGNEWGAPVYAMLHERTQADSIRTLGEQDSIFEHLELQMECQEADFADTIATLKRDFIFTDIPVVEAFLKSHRTLVACRGVNVTNSSAI